jgi:hypothetical protein
MPLPADWCQPHAISHRKWRNSIFLNALFVNNGSKITPRKIDFIEAIVGGINTEFNEIRYVLDGSPAMKSGMKAEMKIGDKILTVNDAPFVGQLSFAGTAGRLTKIIKERDKEKYECELTPILEDDYKEYVRAINESARVIQPILDLPRRLWLRLDRRPRLFL